MAFNKQEREELVEELGVHLERSQQLPPLASRIFALMILCSKSGYSFEDIINFSQASKSSVSTNLNLLLKSGIAEYYTKPGDRKRYFRLSKSYIRINLEDHAAELLKRIKVLDKISAYRTQQGKTGEYHKYKKFEAVYRDYLKAHRQNIKNTITKMNQLEKTV